MSRSDLFDMELVDGAWTCSWDGNCASVGRRMKYTEKGKPFFLGSLESCQTGLQKRSAPVAKAQFHETKV